VGDKVSTAEREIARLATASAGVVTRRELLEAGLTRKEIENRVRRGLLIPEYRGVYRAGHRAPSVAARYLAAVRACGDRAVLSAPPAAYLYGVIKGAAPPPEVLAPGEHRIPGLRTHRCGRLDPRDITTFDEIPVLTVPRTIVDLAGLLSPDQLARACHEAGVRHRTTPRDVEAVLKRHPNSHGAAKLRAVMSGDVRVTLSKLERAFLELLRERGFPLPKTNRVAGGRRVDCRWPEYCLTIELDSYQFHNSRYAWEQDRRREREARARGDEFRRYTYGDIVEDGRYVVKELHQLLPVG
jgi:very-short-patch-repair endonuclease